MRITLVTVGKIKEKYLKDAIAEYSKRLGKYCKLEIIEVADEKTPENASATVEDMIRQKEGERILKYIKEDAYVVALAIDGQRLSSEKLAEKIKLLGIQGTSVDEESAAAFGMPRGVYVYKILEEGAAAQSDLREKDIITKVDGQSVRNMTDLQELLACYEMGEQIDLTVQSQKDGEYQERTVTITLKAMPQENTETQAQ